MTLGDLAGVSIQYAGEFSGTLMRLVQIDCRNDPASRSAARPAQVVATNPGIGDGPCRGRGVQFPAQKYCLGSGNDMKLEAGRHRWTG
jgi:hypothetical protein